MASSKEERYVGPMRLSEDDLPYRALGPLQGPVCIVALHGFGFRRKFIKRCGLHREGYPVAYPWSAGLGGNWQSTGFSGTGNSDRDEWQSRDAAMIARLAQKFQAETRAERIVLAGFSDGCTPIHEAATICHADGLIHYSGIWTGHVAHCRSAFVYGRRDPTPMPRVTRHAADAYGVDWMEIKGGHRWRADANPQILEALGEWS